MAALQPAQVAVYQPLFADQDKEPEEPRVFPKQLAANITPPVWNQILGNSVTPHYLFGWRIPTDYISEKYMKKVGRYLNAADLWFHLGNEWAETYPQYSFTQPEITQTSFDGFIISMSSNRTRETIGRTRDEDFVRAMSDFLEMHEPAQWLRV